MRNWLKCVGTTRGRSQGESKFEALESRTLLTDGTSPINDVNMIWRGVPMEVRENSWIMTFQRPLGRDAARQQADTVASSLGLVVDRVDVSARGRFATIVTRSQVTPDAVDAAKSRFNQLMQIEPDSLYYPDLVPNDARYPEQWALNNTGQIEIDSGTGRFEPGLIGADMDAERAWNISTGSSRVVIAVIDSGMDIEHPDLAANVFKNPGEIANNGIDDDRNGFIDDVNGWDFGSANPDNDPSDPADPGHGTAVGGTIGAVGNNGIGVAGTAWNIKMLPLKIGRDGPGGFPNSAIVNAIDYVTMMRVDFGVNIVATNNSYGALRAMDFEFGNDAQRVAIEDSTDAGILFVASAGNDAVDNDSDQRAYPASYADPDIIAVAASNNRDLLASFSNFGATTVDVAAPGEQVLTTQVGGGYQLIDGTSFSGPYTAGVVGMIAAVNPFLSKEQIKSILLNSVDVLPQLQGRVLTSGRVNLFRALLNASFEGPLVTAISPGPQTAPVQQIRVAFSKDIDPATYNISGVELRRSNADGRFDSNDIILNLADPNVATVTLSARELVINLNAPLDRDLFRLTLNASNFRDTDGRQLNGSVSSGNNEVYTFNVVAFRGPLEPNDSISQATPVVFGGTGTATYTELTIGDGLFEPFDVDIFRIFATGPSLITIDITARGLGVPSPLDSFVRLFDAGGAQLASNDNFNGLDSKIQFFVSSAGEYFVGVSAYPNRNYDPTVEGSGAGSPSLGGYSLFIQLQSNASEPASRDNDTDFPIPSSGTITSTITLTDGRSISDLNVRINITHSFVGDLRIRLTGPGGQIATLVNRRGGAGDNFTNTVFDDESSASIVAGSPPYTGSYRPESSLTTFDNTTGAGTWTLTIEDLRAGDSGTLLSWGLDLVLNNDVFGPFEVNDTNLIATATDINSSGSRTFNAAIGDGAFGLRDVDIFRFVAGSGTTISALAQPNAGTSVDLILRLFDVAGNEVAADKRRGSTSAAINYVVATAGTYYIGVSGGNTTSETTLGNDNYQLSLGGSGNPTDATGAYSLLLNVSGGISEGAVLLQGNQLSVGVAANGAIGFSSSPPSGAAPTGISLNNVEYLLKNAGVDAYFGASVDGFAAFNAGDNAQTDIAVSLAHESDFTNRRLTITGAFRNLGVRRVLSFNESDRFIAVDVTLTNRSLSVINNLAWMEGFNPDQGYDGANQASRSTRNSIRTASPRLGTAISQTGGLTIGLGAASTTPGAVVSFESRGSVRDPFAIINSVNDPDGGADNGSVSDDDLALAVNLGTLGPSQTTSFRYFIFVDTSVTGVLTSYNAMNGNTGSGHLAADAKSPLDDAEGFSSLPYRIYYPEGFANSRANTFLPIVNGNAENIRVQVIARYEKQIINGVETFYAPDLLYDSLADASGGNFVATRRGGITLTRPDLYTAGTNERVQSEVITQATSTRRAGLRKDVPYALEVRSSAPVGSILSHYDFGIATGDSFTSTLNTTWLLGQGSKGAGISDFVTFYNPGDSSIKVTLTAFPAGGGTPIQINRTVLGKRRGGWSINDIPQIPDGAVSFRVDAEAPIVAALTHFDTNTSKGYGSLAQPGLGSTSGATGEGEFGVGAGSETLSVVNPNTTTANVVFTFAFSSGSSFRHTLTVGGQRRADFDVASLAGFPAGQAYAVSYTSTAPIGVNITSLTQGEEGGSSLAAQASTQWLFAEGFRPAGAVGGNSAVTEFLRLYNPSNTATTIEIVINYTNGDSEVFRRNLPSRAGININIHDFVTGTKAAADAYYGLKIQSSQPIVAFAGHYDSFLRGGFGTLGTPLGTNGIAN